MNTPSQSHAVLCDELAQARERIRQLEAERAIARAANDQRTHLDKALVYLGRCEMDKVIEELKAMNV